MNRGYKTDKRMRLLNGLDLELDPTIWFIGGNSRFLQWSYTKIELYYLSCAFHIFTGLKT